MLFAELNATTGHLAEPYWPSAVWNGTGSVWQSYKRTCASTSRVRRHLTSSPPSHIKIEEPHVNLNRSTRSRRSLSHDRSLPRAYEAKSAALTSAQLLDALSSDSFDFASDASPSHADFCSDSSQHRMHGQFFSDWRTLDDALYPVFSAASAAGYADIAIPTDVHLSALAASSGKRSAAKVPAVRGHGGHWASEQSTPLSWGQKSSAIYWRGRSMPLQYSSVSLNSSNRKHNRRREFASRASIVLRTTTTRRWCQLTGQRTSHCP